MRDKPTTIPEFIEYLARASAAFGQQAGVGAMETAGSAISYLARHPKDLEPFLNGGFMELPVGWHEQGCLTWHAMNGKVVSPDFARRQRQISAMAKDADHG